MSSDNKIVIIEDGKENKQHTHKIDEPQNIQNISNDIFINTLVDRICQITKSQNKNDFVKKYNECHEQIKKVDEIIYKPNALDPHTDIKVLFEMLKEYENLIESEDITVQEYKKIYDLVELIEKKLQNASIDINEV